MLTIARVTRRYYHGNRPDECRDTLEDYFTTYEKALAYVKTILGEDAIKDDNWGFFDSWKAQHLPRLEYFIDMIEVK